MAIQYRITNDDEFSGAVIYLDGEPVTVSSDNPNYPQIVLALTALDQNENDIRALVAPAERAAAVLTKLTERVSYKGGKLYLDGDVLNTDLGAHLVALVGAGGGEDTWKPLVTFLEKLSSNPSKNSRSQLWKFTQANRITIHEDGDLLLYKGLNADGTSINRGYGIVDGVEYGEYDEDTNRITKSDALPNHPGSMVEIPRSMVDPDRNTACSTGLHAGAYAYAKEFAKGKLVTVKINPRDVVSVPSDAANQKVRVCRYVVFEEKADEYSGPTFYEQKPAPVPAEEPVQDENTVTFEESAPAEPVGTVTTVDGQVHVGVIPADAAERTVSVYVTVPEQTADVAQETTETVQTLLGVVQPPEEPEDDSELSDEQIRTNQKLEAYKVLITKDLQPRGENLKRYRNKRVTAGRRSLFDQAVTDLGLSY